MYAPYNEQACGNCRHFRPLGTAEEMEDEGLSFESPIEEGRYGKCTRYPPVFFYPQLLNAEHPVVRSDNHCGEYTPDLP